jgi:hypothetical protein
MCKSKISMRKLILSGIALACGMAGTVQAATILASGPVYGGPSQQQVACEVVNVGTTPITFVKTELLGQFQAPLPLNFNDCIDGNGASLEPNATCNFQAAAGNQATACKVIILEAKTNVRGTTVALSPRMTS